MNNLGKYNDDFIQYSEKKVKNETHNLAFYLSTRIIFYIFLIFFAIFFIWYTAFISTHSFYAVSGVSMMGTLNGQITDEQLHGGQDLSQVKYDAVYVDRMTKAKLFDIVVIDTHEVDPITGEKKNIIKRVMAQAGDYVTIAKARNEAGEEHFYFFRIPSGTNLENFTDDMARVEESGANGYEIYSYSDWDTKMATENKVADGGFHNYELAFFSTFLDGAFVGNVYAGASDDKFYISENGLVYVKVPEGKFFYMGDNRAHSTDARERGFCDTKDIVGRTEFVVYDFNFANRLWEVVKFYFSEVEEFFAR